jgi:signal transduction histidine kinase
MPERLPSAVTTDHDRSERLHVFAHDLRNRLTGLWEVMKALRSGGGGMEPEELYAFAEKGYFQAQREIEDLLEDFQVDRRVRIQEVVSVALGPAIEAGLLREQHRLDRKAQRITLHGDRSACVKGDAHWVGQILQALISNASKFSPRGSTIDVEITQGDSRTEVRVQDPGVGLSDADLEQIFVRYAMLGSRSTDGEQQCRGTLARARQWAEAMQGTLTAESRGVGTGATFRLDLPTADRS